MKILDCSTKCCKPLDDLGNIVIGPFEATLRGRDSPRADRKVLHKGCFGTLHGDRVKKEKTTTEVPRDRKKCSLDSTCSDDSGYSGSGPEMIIHREDFLIYNRKVSLRSQSTDGVTERKRSHEDPSLTPILPRRSSSAMAQRLFTLSTRSTAAKQKEERRGGAVAGAAVKRKEGSRASLETSGLQNSLQEVHKQKVHRAKSLEVAQKQKPSGRSGSLNIKIQGPDRNKQSLGLARSNPGLIKALSPDSHQKYADLSSPKPKPTYVKNAKFNILRASTPDVSELLPAQDRGLLDKRQATPGYSSLPRPGKKKYSPRVSGQQECKTEDPGGFASRLGLSPSERRQESMIQGMEDLEGMSATSSSPPVKKTFRNLRNAPAGNSLWKEKGVPKISQKMQYNVSASRQHHTVPKQGKTTTMPLPGRKLPPDKRSTPTYRPQKKLSSDFLVTAAAPRGKDRDGGNGELQGKEPASKPCLRLKEDKETAMKRKEEGRGQYKCRKILLQETTRKAAILVELCGNLFICFV